MKKIRLILVAVLAADLLVALTASAKGLLPSMVYRRGLTNEQIDKILSAHPDAQLRITAQDWRAMKYQLCRFDCMTNYVELIGGTNDAARLLLSLHDRAETLEGATNALAKIAARVQRERDEAAERAQEYAAAYTSATNSLRAALVDYTSASNRAARAEARHNAVVSWAEEQRDKALLPTTKAIWQSFIDRLKREDD